MRFARTTHCQGGRLRDARREHIYAGRWWRWRFNRCDTCDVLVLPYMVRFLDPRYWSYALRGGLWAVAWWVQDVRQWCRTCRVRSDAGKRGDHDDRLCRHCGAVIHQLDQAGADAVNRLHPGDEDGQPVVVAGDWITGRAGVRCPEVDLHEPDDASSGGLLD